MAMQTKLCKLWTMCLQHCGALTLAFLEGVHVAPQIVRLRKKVCQASSLKMKMTRHVQCIVERYGADFAKSENEILNLELLRRLSA